MQKFTCGEQAAQYFEGLYGKKTLPQLKRYENLVRRFRKKYNADYCYLASSSGRVELIGNHTDHNGGKVAACAVNLDIVAAFLPADKVEISGDNYRDICFAPQEAKNVQSGSTGMVKGVMHALSSWGKNTGGFVACVSSVLPSGSGLSSSAAFQLLTAAVQDSLYNGGEVDAVTLAKAGQYAENVYFRKPCGLLDQAVIAIGGAVKADFSCGQFTSFDMGNLQPIVINTGKSHASLTQQYAAIPQEMAAVAAYFGKEKLCQVEEKDFFDAFREVVRHTGERPALRARHFFTENRRVEQFCDAAQRGQTQRMLQLLDESGESSRRDLQNCGSAKDAIVQALRFCKQTCPQCACRVHGGGFGGTVLAIAPPEHREALYNSAVEKFGAENVFRLTLRRCGATVL